jgi:hypothetical protein
MGMVLTILSVQSAALAKPAGRQAKADKKTNLLMRINAHPPNQGKY